MCSPFCVFFVFPLHCVHWHFLDPLLVLHETSSQLLFPSKTQGRNILIIEIGHGCCPPLPFLPGLIVAVLEQLQLQRADPNGHVLVLDALTHFMSSINI